MQNWFRNTTQILLQLVKLRPIKPDLQELQFTGNQEQEDLPRETDEHWMIFLVLQRNKYLFNTQ